MSGADNTATLGAGVPLTALSNGSHQITASTVLLLGLIFAAMAALALWSWRHRRTLGVRRRRAEAALRFEQNRHSHLSSQLPIALFSFRPGHGFDSVSDGIERLLPLNAKAVLSDPLALFAAISPAHHAGLSWIAGTGDCPAQVEWLGASAESPPRWLQIRANADIGPDGQRQIVGVMFDVTPLKRVQQALEESREALRLLAGHREAAREAESRRLAREFHDELGQLLTAIRLRLPQAQSAQRELSAQTVGEIDAMLVAAYQSVKAIAADLRPPALNLGLGAAIEWQAEQSLLPAGVRFTRAVAGEAEQLSDETRTTLFRIVQEAFTNIARYAAAHTVHVSVRLTAGALCLDIADDGIGFDPTAVDRTAHFGLAGMEERAMALGATLEVDSAPGEGTRILLTLPCVPARISR